MKPCLDWWKDREDSKYSWSVDAKGLIGRNDSGQVTSCNLDIRNPHVAGQIDHRSPLEIVESIELKEKKITSIMTDIKHTLSEIV